MSKQSSMNNANACISIINWLNCQVRLKRNVAMNTAMSVSLWKEGRKFYFILQFPSIKHKKSSKKETPTNPTKAHLNLFFFLTTYKTLNFLTAITAWRIKTILLELQILDLCLRFITVIPFARFSVGPQIVSAPRLKCNTCFTVV